MALTVVPLTDLSTKGKTTVWGDRRVGFATIQFDNSYPTGGEAVGTPEAAALSMTQIDFVIPLVSVLGNRIVTWDAVNKKLMLFTALGTEAVNATDQSTITCPCVVIGK